MIPTAGENHYNFSKFNLQLMTSILTQPSMLNEKLSEPLCPKSDTSERNAIVIIREATVNQSLWHFMISLLPQSFFKRITP